MDMSHEMQQQMAMRISPRLIQANHVLELSSMELQHFMNQELEENPALEMTEATHCPQCGSLMVDSTCHTCALRERQEATTPEIGLVDLTESYLDVGPGGGTHDEEFDPLSLVAAQMSLSERLFEDLVPLLSDAREQRIAEYLIGMLNDNGYLQGSTAEVAEAMGVARELVESVLVQLQSLEPVGVGARDLRECLLIQLAYLETQGRGNPLASTIVQDYFSELGEHKYGRIAQALGVPQEEVVEAAHFVREKLNPHPAQQVSDTPHSTASEIPRYMLPDIIIKRGEGGLELDVVESRRFLLQINSSYQDMWRAVQSRPAHFSDGDREHIRHYMSRAKMFMANVTQRRQTMQKIGEFLVENQEDFLLHGIRHLKPLTRAVVAQYTGMHESTVSRATAGKYVMIPSGRVIPFSDFFTPALNVKDVLKEIVEGEPDPLTDHEIMERLATRGYHIARRTVAKYRDQLGILPSPLRN